MDYDKDIIYIYGKNFTEGTYDPVVTLGDLRLTPLPGFNFTDNEFRLIFPEVEAGDYKLTVVTGETRHCRDKQSVKIAYDNEPSCPPAPPPTPCEQCPPGLQGEKGEKGDKGDKGIKEIPAHSDHRGPRDPKDHRVNKGRRDRKALQGLLALWDRQDQREKLDRLDQ